MNHTQCDVTCSTPQIGSYKFSVSNTQSASVDVTSREAVVRVFPAMALADTSSMSVNMGNMAVGANATVIMWLNDYNGDPMIMPDDTTTIIIVGRKL